ncbi:EAL and HDOD domain-containing protein [Methylococcus sp. EFPC2]|uniref:EAL and HDOD domain-containing protein n=1 Tax=Methylococcus sp. EFPC2 TaxID=2812648 RepID=UPI00196831D3|nr:HDOD domain-containing protein [Methylococcus sp. EFPC2]QSA96938.1 HDOD domain-containing protein [Methylococcus sp. EFPC2]
MQEFLIGRQQIFDRNLDIFAYELLFRDAQGRGPQETEATDASNEVIVNSLLEEGLNKVVGPHRAFINFTRENLLNGTAHLLPKDKVVIEILESVAIDDALIGAVQALARDGYTIALDDFVLSDPWLPVIKLAHIVKLDILNMSPETGRKYMELLGRFSVKFLAEKVETHEQYIEYRTMGCDYFQGYLFSRPHVVQGKKTHHGHHAVVRLLAEINRADVDVGELAQIISTDARLSYKLLRYLNTSAAFGLRKKIETIRHAIVMLGLNETKRWASLLALVSFPAESKEIIVVSLSRAKMCERLAVAAHRGSSDEFFLTGLMSMLDHMLGAPLDEIIEDLPLADAVARALVNREGVLGEALNCVIDYEHWSLDTLRFSELPVTEIGRAYRESVAWANEVAASLDLAG